MSRGSKYIPDKKHYLKDLLQYFAVVIGTIVLLSLPYGGQSFNLWRGITIVGIIATLYLGHMLAKHPLK